MMKFDRNEDTKTITTQSINRKGLQDQRFEEFIPLPVEQQALQQCQLLQMIDLMRLAAWILLQQW